MTLPELRMSGSGPMPKRPRKLLYSYRLGFDFKTDAGELNYLSGASFRVERVGFADKYFPGIIF